MAQRKQLPKTHKPLAKKTVKNVRLSKRRRILLFWQSSRLPRKLLIVIFIISTLWIGGMYGVARWYIASHASEPYKLGVTFVPRYARYFGTDPKQSMQAMIDELGVRNFRLVSYWDDMEATPGVYYFDELDWQFKMAEDAGAKVSLAIGLRQPRWPECHMPTWAEKLPKDEWAPKLKDFMGKVIERYGNSRVLESYQLENEYFMTVFGICPDFSRDRLVDEYNYVKSKDADTPIIVSRSNNWIGIPFGDPRPDVVGISVYKRVWDKTFTKRYFEYPLPAWFYSMLAGIGEIVTGKNMVIHELQAEPWTPDGIDLKRASTEEQYKSLNPERLKDRFEYAKATGIKEIYFWGAEWWYWRKVSQNDPGVWNVAKEEFTKTNTASRQ